MEPEALRDLAGSIFRKLQECWEKREYDPMKPLLMESLFLQHVAQLQRTEKEPRNKQDGTCDK